MIQHKTDLTEIESGIKNKFKWNWLSEKDGNIMETTIISQNIPWNL